jgi:hypothetical protein
MGTTNQLQIERAASGAAQSISRSGWPARPSAPPMSACRSWCAIHRTSARCRSRPHQRHGGQWPRAAGAASVYSAGPCEPPQPSPERGLLRCGTWNSRSNSAKPPRTVSIRRRQIILPDDSQQAAVQDDDLFAQRPPHDEQRLRQYGEYFRGLRAASNMTAIAACLPRSR